MILSIWTTAVPRNDLELFCLSHLCSFRLGLRRTACSLVGFSQPKSASQQCFLLTKNQQQPAQTSTSINQQTGPKSELRLDVFFSYVLLRGPNLSWNWNERSSIPNTSVWSSSVWPWSCNQTAHGGMPHYRRQLRGVIGLGLLQLGLACQNG